MQQFLTTLLLLAPVVTMAAEFKLEGYDREVNDGTVVRESATAKNVNVVRMHRCRASDAALEHIARWPDLRGVYLRDTAITGSGFSHLKDHRQLTQVTLSGPNVNDDGAAALAELPRVTHLQVGNGYRWDGLVYEPQLTDAALKSIASMDTIEYLSIDGACITDKGLLHLARLPNVRSIQFFRCPQLTAAGLNRLKERLPECNISVHESELSGDE